MAEETGEKDDVLTALQECQQRLSELKQGDDLIQQAENTFGRLADRVDTVLHERRVTPDRRGVNRAGADRRRNSRNVA